MNQLTRSLFIFALCAASVSAAFAQADPKQPGQPGGAGGAQTDPAGGGGKPDEKPAKRLEFAPLPLVSYNTDDGFGYGLRVYANGYDEGYAPYKYQVYGQYYKTTRGYEYQELSIDQLKFAGTPLRIKMNMGLERTLNAQWYGYGNAHDIPKQEKIKKGEVPINENVPASRDMYQLDEDFGVRELTINERGLQQLQRGQAVDGTGVNPGPRYLKETQNKYFYYDRISPFFTLTSEDFILGSNFKWYGGIRAKQYRIQSYQGDREAGNFYPNGETLIDQDHLTGYDATEKPRYVNGVRVAFAYDSRPRVREKNPNDGIFADVHTETVGKGTGSAYSFYRVTATYRQYFEILPSVFKPMDRELVFAFRLLGQKTTGDVPFFEAGRIYTMDESNEGIGGNRGVRGYNANQFVDKVYAIFNTELRLTTFKVSAIGGIDFVFLGYYDVGRVAERVDELDGTGLHSAVGLGLRLVWKRNTIINISSGKSKYGSNTNFSFNHMF